MLSQVSKNYAREVKVKKQLRLRDGENKQVSEYEVWVRYPLQKNCKYRTYLWDRFKLFQFVFVFVTALVNQFSSFIKGSTSVWGQNVIFFCKTKIALSTSMLVWFGLTDDFPWDGWVQTRVLACPDVFRKFSRLALLPVSERLHVIVVACFEFGLAQTNHIISKSKRYHHIQKICIV